MLGDDGLYRQVVNHPLVEALGKGGSRGPGPSLYSISSLCRAMLDSIVDRAVEAKTGATKMDMTLLTIESLRDYLQELDEHKFSIASALASIVRRTETLEVPV